MAPAQPLADKNLNQPTITPSSDDLDGKWSQGAQSNLSSIPFRVTGESVDIHGPMVVPEPPTLLLLRSVLLCLAAARSRFA
jgi:hypothetical protein